ncbi:MAG: formate--tetrahydrofolate ligase [Clostridiales bacterium GWF2_38_85]|nr:MAG: formate--tetrahydrofolate ligase [Clostridiales bacterium GWF2_38_85]HBL85268.1 formate--tetrahydrofolate ligase [Clostridiales bacterium]
MKSDVQIASEAKMVNIKEIAAKIGLTEDDIEQYGKYKAKITAKAREKLQSKPDGKLILVTAINPTPAGEGKTTTTVGLGQAMAKIGKKAIIAIREPSLGPVFGMKGGAAGGGYSQVMPMDEINLHFTGDFHAITSANNLLCAMLDNHIYHGNELNIDPARVIIKRTLDMNDRALRRITVEIGENETRNESFMITVASEIMAILCLSESLSDLKEKLGNILVAYDKDGYPVYSRQLKADGAMAALLKNAVDPNLVQTIENTPCIIHGGPFANIAHGCNSVIATRTALKLGDYCITEAGFGADLGAQKFFDIKCRKSGLIPSAVVLVVTVRALKYNGGVQVADLSQENLDALNKGICNLTTHIENLKNYNLPVIVAINHFYTDTESELAFIKEHCETMGVPAVVSKAFALGGEGAEKLATKLCEICNSNNANFKLLYNNELSIKDKIETIATKIYRAGRVEFNPDAKEAIKGIEKLGYANLPVCIAKTQYSLSDDPKLLGAPKGHTINIRDIYVSAGAGFIVALAGKILTMPGLPKRPSAERINIDDNGNISGIF